MGLRQHTTVRGQAIIPGVLSKGRWHSVRAQVSAQSPLLPQGFILLPKTECDVREVEFARCLRLRQTSLEPVAFRLPRVRVRLGVQHPNTGSPFSASIRGFGPITKLSCFTALWANNGYSYFVEILKLAETPDQGPGSFLTPFPRDAGVPWACGRCCRVAPSSPYRKSSSKMTCSQTHL